MVTQKKYLVTNIFIVFWLFCYFVLLQKTEPWKCVSVFHNLTILTPVFIPLSLATVKSFYILKKQCIQPQKYYKNVQLQNSRLLRAFMFANPVNTLCCVSDKTTWLASTNEQRSDLSAESQLTQLYRDLLYGLALPHHLRIQFRPPHSAGQHFNAALAHCASPVHVSAPYVGSQEGTTYTTLVSIRDLHLVLSVIVFMNPGFGSWFYLR